MVALPPLFTDDDARTDQSALNERTGVVSAALAREALAPSSSTGTEHAANRRQAPATPSFIGRCDVTHK